MTRTLPPDDPLGPEGAVMSGPEPEAGVAAAFRPDEARDPAGRWAGHGEDLAGVHRRLGAIPGMLGVGGQLHSAADRRLAATLGDIGDELAEGPDAADWEWIRGKLAGLEAAEQDAARRGRAGDSRARALAGELAGLRAALTGLAGR